MSKNSHTSTMIVELVRAIANTIVDHPEKVFIDSIECTNTLIITLSVEKSDIGKIIGKGGKTINAIRTILMCITSKSHFRMNLEVLETEE